MKHETYKRNYAVAFQRGRTFERCSMGVGCDQAAKCYAAAMDQPERCPLTVSRDELRDEIWDALMNREDIGVSLKSLADAVLERLTDLGILVERDEKSQRPGAISMTLVDAFNARFQELLYALIDSKADGLRDCTVTEVVNVAAVAFGEAGEDALAAGTGTAETRETAAQSEGCQSGGEGVTPKDTPNE